MEGAAINGAIYLRLLDFLETSNSILIEWVNVLLVIRCGRKMFIPVLGNVLPVFAYDVVNKLCDFSFGG